MLENAKQCTGCEFNIRGLNRVAVLHLRSSGFNNGRVGNCGECCWENPVTLDARTQVFTGRRYRLYDRKHGTIPYFQRIAHGETLLLHREVYKHHNGIKSIDKSIHVHHIDEDFRNNSIDNLEAIDGRKHNRQHGLDRDNSKWSEAGRKAAASRPFVKRECRHCGSEFESQVDHALFCSSLCRLRSSRGKTDTGPSRMAANLLEKTCEVCTKTFTTRRKDKTVCSKTCWQRRSRSRSRG